MGGLFSFGHPPAKVLLTGLDAAGKTTLLFKLNMTDYLASQSIGMDIETARYKHLQVMSWNSGGSFSRAKTRSTKIRYADESAGVIYVIDMADKEMFPEAMEELERELSYLQESRPEDEVPLLIFANKMDLATSALTKDNITDNSYFKNVTKNRAWHIQPCSALNNDRLQEGMYWLIQQIAARQNRTATTATCDLNEKQ